VGKGCTRETAAVLGYSKNRIELWCHRHLDGNRRSTLWWLQCRPQEPQVTTRHMAKKGQYVEYPASLIMLPPNVTSVGAQRGMGLPVGRKIPADPRT
jgi:hypothetical protein